MDDNHNNPSPRGTQEDFIRQVLIFQRFHAEQKEEAKKWPASMRTEAWEDLKSSFSNCDFTADNCDSFEAALIHAVKWKNWKRDMDKWWNHDRMEQFKNKYSAKRRNRQNPRRQETNNNNRSRSRSRNNRQRNISLERELV